MSQVLIATATYSNAMRPETARSIKATVFGGGWLWYQSRCNPHPAPHRGNYLAQAQHIAAKTLGEGWDAVLLVEHDMEIPADALQNLWDTGADVAYGVYLLRHGYAVVNAFEYIKPGVLGESLSFYKPKLRKAIKDVVVPVSGIGFGCTLIRRHVLEAVPFREDANGAAPDTPFALDCVGAGVSQVAHFGVICGHWHNGRMIYPMADDRETTQLVKALQTFNALVFGQSVQLIAGREYHIPHSQVSDLAKCGYVEPLEVSTERKGRIVPASGDKDVRPAPPDATTKPPKPRKPKRQGL